MPSPAYRNSKSTVLDQMQPLNSIFSDHYTHHQPSQYYSHFPTQNPNPYPFHQQHHLQIEPYFTTTDPHPPGVDPYLRSYSISHAANAHRVIDPAPPPAYVSELVARNWAAEESVQRYGNTLYAGVTGATVAQDVSQQLPPAIPTHSTWTRPNPTVVSQAPWKKIPKKTKIAQPAWCEICKIACTTRDVLYKHKLGKKHLKNEKLISSGSVVTTSTTTSNPAIGPVENPKKGNFGIKTKAETAQDLEIKKMKVLQGGAAESAVRTCTFCNVVCNSDTVFRFHIAGQKHLSMIQRLQQGAVV